ncbi:1-aminocyclopropane-1-carboxylate deaminase/D-cysteine desulfhydrase [Kaistella sp.]|uniref:1-aminocyclopropane-1-carboxylate deaminase/D-cysteine desulfhydrase n=1 Tax=Kaistella sp. TaxID=2782235 RepID=UPI003C57B42E
MKIPEILIPIIEIPLKKNIQLFVKREDLVHPEISGNKYWKLFYNINNYLDKSPEDPFIITFGGAFSNHISAVSALGKKIGITTLGIIRGEEIQNKWQENPTLKSASENGMNFRFVTREIYRNKEPLIKTLEKEFPNALIIPEGGTNKLAVEGIRHMLSFETKSFDYLCAAVGTGGTIAGISKFAEENQKVLGFKVVDDISLNEKISAFTERNNFTLFEAHDGSYGKITNENIRFINDFKEKFGIQLDPIYTGKMMRKIFELVEENFFLESSKILAFHTGGLQGILGANELLRKKNRD